MSSSPIEDDTKLKDLIIATFKASGYWSNLKSDIYEKTYNILANDSDSPIADNKALDILKTTTKLCVEPYLQSEEGALALYLIKDMLNSLGLEHTSRLFEIETGCDEDLSSSSTKHLLSQVLQSLDIEGDKNDTIQNPDSTNKTELTFNASSTAKSRPLLVEIIHKLMLNRSNRISETFIKSPGLSVPQKSPDVMNVFSLDNILNEIASPSSNEETDETKQSYSSNSEISTAIDSVANDEN